MGQKYAGHSWHVGVVCCTRFFPWGGRAEKPNTSDKWPSGEVAVIEREGHAYAEIEALARMTNAR